MGTIVDAYGVRRFRVDDVAAEAGVTRQTVTNHFGTKDQLLQTWMELEHERLGEVFVAIAAAAPDLRSGLATAAEETLGFLAARRALRPPLRRDTVAYLASDWSQYADVFSRATEDRLAELGGASHETAVAAAQAAYRLIDSFALKPTDLLSRKVQAEIVADTTMAILAWGQDPS